MSIPFYREDRVLTFHGTVASKWCSFLASTSYKHFLCCRVIIDWHLNHPRSPAPLRLGGSFVARLHPPKCSGLLVNGSNSCFDYSCFSTLNCIDESSAHGVGVSNPTLSRPSPQHGTYPEHTSKEVANSRFT